MIGQHGPMAPADRSLWIAAGTLLRICRQVRGWEQADLAGRAGVSVGAVARAELGLLGRPRPDLWPRLTAALGLELEPFLRAAADRAGVGALVASDDAFPVPTGAADGSG